MPWLPCLTCSEKESFSFLLLLTLPAFHSYKFQLCQIWFPCLTNCFILLIYIYSTQSIRGGGVKANKLFVLLSLPFCLVVEKRELFLFFYSSRTATLGVYIYIYEEYFKV
jgi:hypothetical protein